MGKVGHHQVATEGGEAGLEGGGALEEEALDLLFECLRRQIDLGALVVGVGKLTEGPRLQHRQHLVGIRGRHFICASRGELNLFWMDWDWG